MTLTETLAGLGRTIAHSGADVRKTRNAAVILAAGCGARMANALPETKQMTLLGGLPVVVRSILAFENCDFISEIVVVGREDELPRYREFAAQYGLRKIRAVVKGGETRQQSALCGMEAVSDKAEFIAVHDAARCLVTPAMIEAVQTEAAVHGCATAACRARDTVKTAGGGQYIASTVDRDTVWLAQTPQTFRADIYRAASYIALENGTSVTDDNSMVEALGFRVKLVDCGCENIKLTVPVDFYIAEAILKSREQTVTDR